jgi:hypothetical protein
MMSPELFDQLREQLDRDGVEATLGELLESLRNQKQFHPLFDAYLLRARFRADLPIISTTSLDDLPEPLRGRMEEAYLDACREVGHLLLAEGRIAEAWHYLRPVGDREAVAQAIARSDPGEEQLQEVIDVALQGGVAPEQGIRLVLDHWGTCNAITMFEQSHVQWSPPQKESAAIRLVGRVHEELLQNLRADIAKREGSEPESSSITELLADREGLFTEDNYHIDTSHLNAVVRFARFIDKLEPLGQALELTEYGRRLASLYQFPGEEPFAEVFPSHGLFFRALLGQDVEEALAFFRQKAEEYPASEYSSAVVEVYVSLLARVGRPDEALAASLEMLSPEAPASGLAPGPFELAERSGHYDALLEACQRRGDLVGYTAALVQSRRPAS